MQVLAATGLKVPMEDKPREYITDAVAVEVNDTAYYLRRISDGDLQVQDSKVQVAKNCPFPLEP